MSALILKDDMRLRAAVGVCRPFQAAGMVNMRPQLQPFHKRPRNNHVQRKQAKRPARPVTSKARTYSLGVDRGCWWSELAIEAARFDALPCSSAAEVVACPFHLPHHRGGNV